MDSPDQEPDDPWYATVFLVFFVLLTSAVVCGGVFAYWSSYQVARNSRVGRPDTMEAIQNRFWIGALGGALLAGGWMATHWREKP